MIKKKNIYVKKKKFLPHQTNIDSFISSDDSKEWSKSDNTNTYRLQTHSKPTIDGGVRKESFLIDIQLFFIFCYEPLCALECSYWWCSVKCFSKMCINRRSWYRVFIKIKKKYVKKNYVKKKVCKKKKYVEKYMWKKKVCKKIYMWKKNMYVKKNM